ncbi:MAG: mitofilin family membrane protein [Proteobacteria bacterium]|nr:mitofilin family membrane protein [Pseudomonadota bacterium]
MTDSEKKGDLPDKDSSADKGGSLDKGGSPEKSSAPSTLEKAVAKRSKDREAETEKQAPGKKADGAAAADPPRRSLRPKIIGALSLLLVLAIAYIARPVWIPALPGWMQASLAPVMEAGGDADSGAQIARLAAKIEPLEKDISGLKAEFAARPVADPARLLALDDLVRQNGERLAALKTEIDTLSQGTAGGVREDDFAILSKRIAELETRLVTLAAPPAGTAAPDAAATAAAVSALDALRTQSSERMAALERDNVALRRIVALLDKRVGAIEQKPATASGTTRRNALVLAVGQLREAGRGTAPFAAALQAVEALAESQETLVKPIGALKPHAKTGVPDLIALRLHFSRIAGRIAHESFVPKGEGWIDRTLGRVSRIFTFRRTGPNAAASDDENGRVARAELRLAAGDLETAVTILEGLQEPGLTYAGPWLKEARARLDVDGAIKILFSEALARAQATGDGKGAPGG